MFARKFKPEANCPRKNWKTCYTRIYRAFWKQKNHIKYKSANFTKWDWSYISSNYEFKKMLEGWKLAFMRIRKRIQNGNRLFQKYQN